MTEEDKNVDLTISARSLIAHQVPRPVSGDDTAEPLLSEAVPDLPTNTLAFFARRLMRSIQGRGQPVEVDPRFEDPRLPGIIIDLLNAEEPDLVEPSQRAARHLLGVQPGSPYETQSLFVTADVVANGVDSIAVMKLEREEGVHVHSREIDGRRVLDVEILEDLMLTDNTRVFKAGVFWLDQDALKGYVSDDQQGARDDPARYFLQRFLGCRLERSPSVVTRDFFQAAEDFFSEQVGDGETKLRYYTALQAELASNRNQIDPVQFASDHLRQQDRGQFEEHLRAAGVPTAAFDKNTSKLGTRVSRSRLKTSSGITISGSASDFGERVEVAEYEGSPAVVVKDTVAGV